MPLLLVLANCNTTMMANVKSPPAPAPVMARPIKNVASELEKAVIRLPIAKTTAERKTQDRGANIVLIRPVNGAKEDMAT